MKIRAMVMNTPIFLTKTFADMFPPMTVRTIVAAMVTTGKSG